MRYTERAHFVHRKSGASEAGLVEEPGEPVDAAVDVPDGAGDVAPAPLADEPGAFADWPRSRADCCGVSSCSAPMLARAIENSSSSIPSTAL